MNNPDYADLLDADMLAYLDHHASFAPKIPNLKNNRAAYSRFCQSIRPSLPESRPDIEYIDAKVADVPTRLYRGINPLVRVVFFHGGGFVLGSLQSHHGICAELCARTGFDVLAVDYRLAPEHPHPAQLEDALAVIDAQTGKIILMGDSAGATLAASASLKRRNRIHGQMLVYPWLDKPGEHASFRQHANAPVLNATAINEFETLRLAGQPRPDNADYFPLMGDDFNNLPPSYISVAEFDPLHDEGVLFNTLQIFSGGMSVLMEEPGLMHGHMHARHHSTKAALAFDHIIQGLENLAEWK